LTTVAQSLRDQGIRCAELVLGEHPERERERERGVDWSLVRRGSTRGAAH
jgi:DNA-binding LacI/PurR family transcriptional regulator